MDDLGPALHETLEAVSGWSIAQHMYHVVLATDLGLANVLSLVREKGMLVREDGELGEYAKSILTASKTERGTTQAPRMVQPGRTVEKEQIENEFGNLDSSLALLKEPPIPIEGCPGWINHQVLDTLNASHWTRFCRLHAEHHLAIMRDIETALSAR